MYWRAQVLYAYFMEPENIEGDIARYDRLHNEKSEDFNPNEIIEKTFGIPFDKKPKGIPYNRWTKPLLYLLDDEFLYLDDNKAGSYSTKRNAYVYRTNLENHKEHVLLHETMHALHYQISPEYFNTVDAYGRSMRAGMGNMDMFGALKAMKMFFEGIAEWGETEAFARHKGLTDEKEIQDFHITHIANGQAGQEEQPSLEKYTEGHSFVEGAIYGLKALFHLPTNQALIWLMKNPPYSLREIEAGGLEYVKRAYLLEKYK